MLIYYFQEFSLFHFLLSEIDSSSSSSSPLLLLFCCFVCTRFSIFHLFSHRTRMHIQIIIILFHRMFHFTKIRNLGFIGNIRVIQRLINFGKSITEVISQSQGIRTFGVKFEGWVFEDFGPFNTVLMYIIDKKNY
jgi:hypothetical protein